MKSFFKNFFVILILSTTLLAKEKNVTTIVLETTQGNIEIELNEKIRRHFRHIAENTRYDIQRSRLSQDIKDTIKHIAEVHLRILAEGITDSHGHNAKLIGGVEWYQSFFWAMFSKK